jgi:hypothetical protein
MSSKTGLQKRIAELEAAQAIAVALYVFSEERVQGQGSVFRITLPVTQPSEA